MKESKKLDPFEEAILASEPKSEPPPKIIPFRCKIGFHKLGPWSDVTVKTLPTHDTYPGRWQGNCWVNDFGFQHTYCVNCHQYFGRKFEMK